MILFIIQKKISLNIVTRPKDKFHCPDRVCGSNSRRSEKYFRHFGQEFFVKFSVPPDFSGGAPLVQRWGANQPSDNQLGTQPLRQFRHVYQLHFWVYIYNISIVVLPPVAGILAVSAGPVVAEVNAVTGVHTLALVHAVAGTHAVAVSSVAGPILLASVLLPLSMLLLASILVLASMLLRVFLL